MEPDLQALLQQAMDLDRAGRYAEAEPAYAAYLARQPFHAAVWADLGGVQRMAGAPDRAERSCRKALALDPHLAPAHVDLAHVLNGQGRPVEAETHCRRVLAREPDHAQALLALSDARAALGDLDEAQRFAERAWSLAPALPDARDRCFRLAFLRRDLPALLRADAPEAADAEAPLPRYERSRWQLLLGDFEAGWAGFEHRHDVARLGLASVPLAGPRWRGEAFPGKTLLLHREQGLGDTLMALRFLPAVKALGGSVSLVVPPALLDLAATCPGIDQLVAEGDPLPPHDLHAFLLSLPGLFGANALEVPGPVPYLRVPPRVPHRAALEQALGASQGRLRIGLAWGGNPAYIRDRERSIPGPLWAPLADLPDLAWFGLQLGRDDPPPLPGFTDLAPHLGSFADSAFALAHLDLLLSVDSAVAHLAGALGVPTFLLIPFQPDWRWMLDRDDTPWYPRHRLYRQPAPGRWAEVMQAVRSDLLGDAP